MKNFPEHDQFDELEKRLQNYTESPDDLVWKNIDAALRPQRTTVLLPWVDYFASAMAVFLLVFFIPADQAGQTERKPEVITEQSPVTRNKRSDSPSQVQEKQKNNHINILNDSVGKPLSENKVVLSRTNPKMIDRFRVVEESKTQESMLAEATQEIDGQEARSGMNDGGALPLNAEELHIDSAAHDQKGTDKETRVPKRRPAFYANITPSLSFQRAIPIASDEVVVHELSDVSILSAERLGISLDAGIQGFINKRLEYYGGLSIYHQHQTLEYSYQKDSQVEVESSGDNSYTVTPKYSMGKVKYEMLNVGVQAGLLYKLYGKNPSHKIGGGLSYQQGFLKGNSEEYQNSESSYLSYQLFYRSEVRVGSRVRVFIQPTFLQSFQVREKLDAPFNLKPYRAGIGFGIIYDF